MKKSGEKRLKTSIHPKNGLYNLVVNAITEPISNETLTIQNWLRPALTPVLQNRDYDRLLEDLQKLDHDLRACGLEELAIHFALDGLDEDASLKQRSAKANFAIYCLRAELLRQLLGAPGFKAYSATLAGSDLFTDFCGCRSILGIKWTSKSTLHRASTFFSDEQLREFNTLLAQAVGHWSSCSQLGLKTPEDLSICLIDSTCLQANIHFPVDWVLLRDVSLTLLKAVKLIRKESLLHRMPDSPEQLIRAMNKLCIEMTHSRRKAGSKKMRKAILRKMKRLLRRIGEHARRRRDLLDAHYGETKLSRAQSDRIIARIDEKLDLLPKVIEQAHERIIGERLLKNEAKILSAYEPDIDVIVRGKAGAQTEFGNELLLAESPGGLIIDYMLYGKGAPSEGAKMLESVERQQAFEVDQSLEALVADRGFDGIKNVESLEAQGITAQICPKDPRVLSERLNETTFRHWQTRRASTEARIAIFKNHTGGRVWRAKGLEHRRIAVGWSVLAHNLAWVGRKVLEEKKQAPPEAA